MSTTDNDARAIAKMNDAEFAEGLQRLERIIAPAAIGTDEWRRAERNRAEATLAQAFEDALEQLGYRASVEVVANIIGARGEEERAAALFEAAETREDGQ